MNLLLVKRSHVDVLNYGHFGDYCVLVPNPGSQGACESSGCQLASGMLSGDALPGLYRSHIQFLLVLRPFAFSLYLQQMRHMLSWTHVR